MKVTTRLDFKDGSGKARRIVFTADERALPTKILKTVPSNLHGVLLGLTLELQVAAYKQAMGLFHRNPVTNQEKGHAEVKRIHTVLQGYEDAFGG